MAERPIGLVLSGGGARGAYEVGALLFIAEELPHLLDRISIITGTSVGALNASYLASRSLTPESVRQLVSIWRGLEIDHLLELSQGGAARLLGTASFRLLGSRMSTPPSGLLSVARIANLATHATDWRGLHRAIKSGRFSAVAVAATDISSGHTHLFVEHAPNMEPSWSVHDPTLSPRRAVLGPHHVLASAAIPFVFPPVRVGGRWYMDGGLRLNTPLSPALSLGAEALVIVTVRQERNDPTPPIEFPGIGQMLGKLLDSLFLDRVTADLNRLARTNDVAASVEALGPEAVERFHAELKKRGRRTYRTVPFASVRPSRDLGAMAAEYLQVHGRRRPMSALRVLRALASDNTGRSADAASFFLFDGPFAEQLIACGRQDASVQYEALAKL